MPLKINEHRCARCGVCEPECPNQAIFQTEDAYMINPALCSECRERYGEPLCQAVCPNQGIELVKTSLLSRLLSKS